MNASSRVVPQPATAVCDNRRHVGFFEAILMSSHACEEPSRLRLILARRGHFRFGCI